MYLKDGKSGDLVEILDLDALFDPNADAVKGRMHAGEEMQESANFSKSGLVFPSGEALPRCWTDVNYKQTS